MPNLVEVATFDDCFFISTNKKENKMIKEFEYYNIVKSGHFLLTSGRHSNEYVNKDAIYCIPELFLFIISKIYTTILNNFHTDDFDVITGPAIAGAILAAPVALKLNKIFVYPEKAIHSEFAEDPNNGVVDTKIMNFNRGYDKILKGKRIIIVEDIITTGGSIQMTADAIHLCDGKVVGIVAIWNREEWKAPNEIKLISLINKTISSYFPNDCPYCQNGIPLQNPKE